MSVYRQVSYVALMRTLSKGRALRRAALLLVTVMLALLAGPAAAAPQDTVITITVGGDCTLGSDQGKQGSYTLGGVLKAQDGDYGYFFRNLQPWFGTDDLTIVNCEGTFTESSRPEERAFNFKGKADYANIFKAGSVEMVNISNNHSMDYGEQGVRDTRRALYDAGVRYFGEKQFANYDVNGIKIGVIGYNMVLNGRNTKEKVAADIQYLKNIYPIVLVSFHWGNENVPRINGTQASFGKWAIDNGADFVFGHHPHILHGIAQYKGKYIVYSLANLCFGGNAGPPDYDTMIVQQRFKVTQDGQVENVGIKVIPCRVSSVRSPNNYQPTPCDADDSARVLSKLQKLCDGVPDGLTAIPTAFPGE